MKFEFTQTAVKEWWLLIKPGGPTLTVYSSYLSLLAGKEESCSHTDCFLKVKVKCCVPISLPSQLPRKRSTETGPGVGEAACPRRREWADFPSWTTPAGSELTTDACSSCLQQKAKMHAPRVCFWEHTEKDKAPLFHKRQQENHHPAKTGLLRLVMIWTTAHWGCWEALGLHWEMMPGICCLAL